MSMVTLPGGVGGGDGGFMLFPSPKNENFHLMVVVWKMRLLQHIQITTPTSLHKQFMSNRDLVLFYNNN
jgi:hypothetical protein